MIITAKFASKCPVCSGQIAPGSKVNWSKGVKASHVTCAAPVVHPHAWLIPYSKECTAIATAALKAGNPARARFYTQNAEQALIDAGPAVIAAAKID